MGKSYAQVKENTIKEGWGPFSPSEFLIDVTMAKSSIQASWLVWHAQCDDPINEVKTCRILIEYDVDGLKRSTISIKLWIEIGWKGICKKLVKPQGHRKKKNLKTFLGKVGTIGTRVIIYPIRLEHINMASVLYNFMDKGKTINPQVQDQTAYSLYVNWQMDRHEGWMRSEKMDIQRFLYGHPKNLL